jgi:aspartate racemase
MICMASQTKTIGVLGGMGPAATADFYQKLIAATPAKRDQDHLTVVIVGDPHVPDRTAAIFGRGPDPTPALAAGAQVLVRAGADFLAMPCITAHHFYPALQRAVPVPILHIVSEAAAAVQAEQPDIRCLGLLATSGTLHTRLFESQFGPRSLAILPPDPALQEAAVMPAIYAVKTGGDLEAARRRIRQAAEALLVAGAQAIIAGCTEVPLILTPADLPVPLVDPTAILARAAVRRALAEAEPAAPEPGRA